MDKFPQLSSEAVKVLRTTTFSGGEIDGVPFIRCGRDLVDGYKLARHIREATGATDHEVTCANHSDFGDYIRVDRRTPLYDFICHLKS